MNGNSLLTRAVLIFRDLMGVRNLTVKTRPFLLLLEDSCSLLHAQEARLQIAQTGRPQGLYHCLASLCTMLPWLLAWWLLLHRITEYPKLKATCNN